MKRVKHQVFEGSIRVVFLQLVTLKLCLAGGVRSNNIQRNNITLLFIRSYYCFDFTRSYLSRAMFNQFTGLI